MKTYKITEKDGKNIVLFNTEVERLNKIKGVSADTNAFNFGSIIVQAKDKTEALKKIMYKGSIYFKGNTPFIFDNYGRNYNLIAIKQQTK